MEDDQPNPVWHLLGAAVGGLLMMAWLTAVMMQPIPLEARNTSPGFGWSWDFAYERAMQEPRLTSDSPINRPAAPSRDELILPVGRPVSIAGLKMTYRGLTGSGRFRVDTAILALDAEYPYPREFGEAEARQGFKLLDEHFVLLSLTPTLLRLRHVPQ